ncbi:hypothetical protein AEA09_07505 [Lysinibacillus contaminans]|uniref:Uncharacterized protein n=2 Tax=Lysinibacillus contaminans TaxID=1293441 RepID=A0ABR5K145_9BACI|nr:hypothetical protein AEA09_07505 [Lysinibacillus contaminans]
MRRMMVFHMGGNMRYLRLIENDFVDTSKQQLIYMRKQHDKYSISPKLSEEQLHQMMQVVEDIRLNSLKKLL